MTRPALRRPLARGTARERGHGLRSPFMSLPAAVVVGTGFLLPLGLLAAYSFWPTVDHEVVVGDWTLGNYTRFFTEEIYWQTLLRSSLFAALASIVTLVLAFPVAYFVATKVAPQRRMAWVLAAVLPFGTSYLIRVLAWLNLLGDTGIINDSLMRIGVLDAPLELLNYGKPAVIITFVYLLFPLAFLTTYIAIERLDSSLLEAAGDLGAKPWRALTRITLPIGRTGLMAGFAFSFITVMGDYVTPQLVGGTRGTMFANLIVTKFDYTVQWGFGSSLALLMLVAMFGVLALGRKAIGTPDAVGQYTRRYARDRAPWLFAYSFVGLLLLYVPIGLLVLFAFNDADFAGLPIQGVTTRWFTAVFDNPILLDSLSTSLTVVAWTLVLSLSLGTVAAVQLARARGRLRNLTLSTIAMPMLLPPVVLGLGIILGLNAIGLDRGLWTIVAGHTVLILPVVTLLVLVRLEGLDPNLELAAMDLGARPRQAFLRVSVPQALPGIVAAALIGFALSMDEFILTFLVTGSQQTLPLYIYSALRFQIRPDLNALSTLMLAASFGLCLLGAAVMVGRGRLARLVGRGPRAPVTEPLGVDTVKVMS